MHATRNILVTLVIVDLLVAAGLWYGYAMMREIKERENALQAEVDTQLWQVGHRIALQKMLTAAEKEHLRIEPFLYDAKEESQIRFISDIERLGMVTTGAFVETRAFEFSPQRSFHGEFALEGTWRELYHFLRLVEEFPARVVINKFDVREADPASSLRDGTISLDLVSLKVSP